MNLGAPFRAVGRFFSEVLGRKVPSASSNHRDAYPVQDYPPDREKLHGGPAGIKLPAFLPYFDSRQTAGETAAHRHAFRQMLSEPVVKAATLTKVFAVASTELHIRPGGKKPSRKKNQDQEVQRYERAVEHAEWVRWSLEDRLTGGVAGLVWSVLIGQIVDGFSICEKVWGREGRSVKWRGKWVLRAIKPKDPDQDLALVLDSFKNIVGVYGLRYNSGETFNPADFLIATHLPLYGNPSGMSDYRAAYGDYWFLDTCRKLRAIAGEKKATPIVAGKYPDPTKQTQLEAALRSLRSQNHLAVPKDVELQVLDLLGASDEFYKGWQADCQERIAIAISGATLQMLAGQAGVERGDTRTHKDTADLRAWHLSQTIVNLLNDHERGLIPDLIDPNFQDADEYPRASMGGVDEAELGESLKVDLGLQQLGFKHSASAVSDRYGREEAEDEGDELTPPGQGGGQPPPGGPGTPPPGTPPLEGDEDDNGVPDDLEALAGIAKHAEWDEGKHPRGQPENPGEFGPGGGVAKIVSPALRPLAAPGSKPASGKPSAAKPGTAAVAPPSPHAAAKWDAIRAVKAAGAAAQADPANAMNRLSSQLATARFGDGPPVKTLRASVASPLTAADHKDAAAYHARAGAVLQARGDVAVAQSHFAAARHHNELSRQGAADGAPPSPSRSVPPKPEPKPPAAEKLPFKGPLNGNRPNEKLAREARPDLSRKEAEAVAAYARTHYQTVNESLRQGKTIPGFIQETHSGLQKAFAKAQPLAEPVTVYRGMSLLSDQMAAFAAAVEGAAKSGKPLAIPGYTSATTDGTMGMFHGNVAIQIRAKKGLDVQPYSSAPDERELLMDHNSKFKVHKVVRTADGGLRVLMEQVL